jgi:hypothetical protein
MSGGHRLSQRLVYWSAILTGLVLVYWGAGAELLPGPLLAPATVSWGKQLLTDLSQSISLPAVGVLLIVLGLMPAIAQQVRENRTARLGVGLVGLGVIGGSWVGLEMPASSLGEVVYLSPLFLAGILLVGLVLPR